MQEFIHSLTGTRMFVADDRVEEYRAAGHRRVPSTKESGNSDLHGGAPKEDGPAADEQGKPTLPSNQPDAKKSNTAQRQKSTGKREVF